MGEPPSIERRDGPAGPRAVLARAGLDVWEVVQTLRLTGNHADRAARYLGLSEEEVRAADDHAAAHPGEIEARLRGERELAEEAFARWRAEAPGA